MKPSWDHARHLMTLDSSEIKAMIKTKWYNCIPEMLNPLKDKTKRVNKNS